MPYLSEAQPET